MRTYRERQTALDGFKAHLDSEPTGRKGNAWRSFAKIGGENRLQAGER